MPLPVKKINRDRVSVQEAVADTPIRVMGLDPSTKFGVAVVGAQCAGGSNEVLFADEICFPKLTGFERITALLDRITNIRDVHKPDFIVIESMFVGHPSSAIPIIQIGSILRYLLTQDRARYLDVPPGTLKKFVCGAKGGGAKKEQVMMYVLKNWGYESKTNNIADAVALAMIGLSIRGQVALTQHQYSTIQVLKDKAKDIEWSPKLKDTKNIADLTNIRKAGLTKNV